MNIIKHLMAFIVICCCCATAPVSARSRDATKDFSREFSKGFDKIIQLMNTESDHAPLIKEMAILTFEKKVAKEIKRKQSSIEDSLENIDDLRQNIQRIREGDYDYWFENNGGTIEQNRQELENEYLERIEKYLAKISAMEKDIAQYTEFQNKIHSWKHTHN